MTLWSVLMLMSHCSSLNWRFIRQSLDMTYLHLQPQMPPSSKVDSTLSWRNLSCSRWQGRSSSEYFSLLFLSSLLSPFVSVLVPISLCPLLQWFVWLNSAFAKIFPSEKLVLDSLGVSYLNGLYLRVCILSLMFWSSSFFISLMVMCAKNAAVSSCTELT